jgi:hypothetical protein
MPYGAYRGLTPRITWGAGYANALVFFGRFDAVIGFPREFGESTHDLTLGGDGVGYTWPEHSILSGIVRRIPRVDTAGVTGWEGATGWDAFLTSWARDYQPFRWIYDATVPGTYTEVFLVEPMNGPPEEEPNRWKRLPLSMRRRDGLAWSGY